MFYKMTLLSLPRDSEYNKKKGSKTRFSNLKMRHPLKPKCDLNHTSRLPTFGVSKSNAKKIF